MAVFDALIIHATTMPSAIHRVYLNLQINCLRHSNVILCQVVGVGSSYDCLPYAACMYCCSHATTMCFAIYKV